MAFASRVDGRRVFVLGIAGLVPAALVTLLLVHQPSVGERRLYPMMRSSLALVGLALALAALITWAAAADRLSRTALSGLAWAGVAAILCIGQFLESSPRVRLYAIDLETGEVEWANPRAGVAPHLFEGDLVVTDVANRAVVGLDPVDGTEQWREALDGDETSALVERAIAAGIVPLLDAQESITSVTSPVTDGLAVQVVDGQLAGTDGRGGGWLFENEIVLDVVAAGDSAYAYIATPGEVGFESGAIVKLDADGTSRKWRRVLRPEMVAVTGDVALDANLSGVVVAGGELVGMLDADDGGLRWTQNVVTLGKSRGYALPGASHQVEVTDKLVYLSTAPAT